MKRTIIALGEPLRVGAADGAEDSAEDSAGGEWLACHCSSRFLRRILLACLSIVWVLSLWPFPAIILAVEPAQVTQDSEPQTKIAFETHIRPLLKQHCFHCHGERGAREGGFDARLKRLLVDGGDSGAAIEPGDADSSYLIERVEAGEMPPEVGKQLSDDEVALLRQWIDAGAPTLRDEPAELADGFVITPEDRQFWSFQPIERPEPPALRHGDRVRTDIDRFVLAKLENRGLTFAPDADKLTLICRVSMDLRGLPPTGTEIDAFLQDHSDSAYEAMVDRMLESPHYGEHWGRHWLDIAGYADSEGTENDQDRPWAFRYRDYVIRAFNENKPLDQFIREQLAGDELVPRPWDDLAEDQVEKLVATGFLRMAADGTAQVNSLEQRNQAIADTIEIVSSSLLGLSVHCARCHDHRYDPISQADYYRLRAVFEPGLNPNEWRVPAQRLISLYTSSDREKAAQVEEQVREVLAEKSSKQADFIAAALTVELEKYDEPLRHQLREAYETEAGQRTETQQALLKQYPAVNITPGVLYQYNQKAADELKQYDAKVAELRKEKPVEPFVRAFWESSTDVPTTHVLHRGDPQQPKEAVEAGGLTITGSDQNFRVAAGSDEASTGRRTALANWLCHPRHPLTARVMANRIWLNHFGQGLVATPADFGRLGEQPTHPELLDWLASELRRRDWDLKSMHRLIMHSTVYRQAAFLSAAPGDSQADSAEVMLAKPAATDPMNQLYWKWPLQRMSAEALRDSWLMVSGQLDRTLYGPSIAIHQDETGQTLVNEGSGRRSIYVRVKRSQPVAMLQLFDQPVMLTNCPRRSDSTAAPQALALMNSPWIQGVATEVVKQVAKPEMTDDEQQWWKIRKQHDSRIAALEMDATWSVGWGSVSEALDRVNRFSAFTFQNENNMQVSRELPDPKTGWVFLSPTGGHPGNGLDHVAIRRWRAPFDGVVTLQGKLIHHSDRGDGVRATVIIEQASEFVSLASDDEINKRSRVGQTSSRRLGQWSVFHQEQETAIESIEVAEGDVINFVVDAKTNEGYDSFQWTFELALQGEPSGQANSNSKWKSSDAAIVEPSAPIAIQLRRLWPQILQRDCTDDEFDWAIAFMSKQVQSLSQRNGQDSPDHARRALAHVAQALMTSNEFLYIE